MPQGDRTGPMGQGSRTGRGLGFCSGYDSAGFTGGFGGLGRGFGFGFRKGRGQGMGQGMGRRHGFMSFQNPSVSREDEIRQLRSHAETLKHTQQTLEKKLEELEKMNR